MTLPQAHITGASNQIGYFLLPRLQQAGFDLTAYSRHTHDSGDGWRVHDLKKHPLHLSVPSVLFHCAGIPLLPHILHSLPDNAPLQRVIAFSSTSAISKKHSDDVKERRLAAELRQAEQDSIALCEQRGIAWTLLRPTLIYGCGRDQNVTFIAHFIHRWGFFPVIGAAQGQRQPVHADDLALACLQVWNQPQTEGQIYTLSGGETLTYRAMLHAIFTHLAQKPRIIGIPLPLMQFVLAALRYIPRFRHLSSSMATRMNQDLVFDHHAAQRDFAYRPRAFSRSDMGILK